MMIDDLPRLGTFTQRSALLAKATTFARYLQCLVDNGNSEVGARAALAEIDPTFAKALIVADRTDVPASALDEFADAVAELSRADSLLGRLAGLRDVPFNVPVPVASLTGSFAWTGQNQLKKVMNVDLTTAVVARAKLAGIVVASEELVRAPAAAAVLRALLVSSAASFIDTALLDPAIAAGPDNPASLTNGVVATVATGNPAIDVPAVLSALFAARPNAISPTLIMSPATATACALSGADLANGRLATVPIVTTPSAGTWVVAIDAAGILWSGASNVAVTFSRNAALEVSAAPAGGAAAIMTSLWQNNLVGFRAESFVGWTRTAVDAVQFTDLATAPPARTSTTSTRKATA